MEAGHCGLNGQSAIQTVKEDSDNETEPVPTHCQSVMVKNAQARIYKKRHAIQIYLVSFLIKIVTGSVKK